MRTSNSLVSLIVDHPVSRGYQWFKNNLCFSHYNKIYGDYIKRHDLLKVCKQDIFDKRASLKFLPAYYVSAVDSITFRSKILSFLYLESFSGIIKPMFFVD